MGRKIWNYEDYEGSLEDTIDKLLERNKTIVCVTILKYANEHNYKNNQDTYFPIRALILYNN